ncbi:MAG: efflux RND transporter periplasmic adaptor subunit [Planctomycetota bacterium]
MTSTSSLSRDSLNPATHSTSTEPRTNRSRLGAAPDQQPGGGETPGGSRRRRFAFVAVFGVAVVALATGLTSLSGGGRGEDDSLVYFTVERRDLPITVTEQGTLESQNDVKVTCEVDDVGGDGIWGTPIIWIVENGVSVEKGDLLVELDESPHQERVDQQILDTEEAEAEFTQAQLNYENQLSRNETARKNAELDVQIAELNTQQYEEIYQFQLQEIVLGIRQRADQAEIARRNYNGMKKLYKAGYKSKGDRAEARLDKMRAEVGLEGQTAKREKLEKYDSTRSRLQLEADLELAEDALLQVIEDNKAKEAQARARLEAAERSLEREKERLARYEEQLKKCKIHAPQKGMVAYHTENRRRGSSTEIAEGVALRPRQTILSIPDLSRMQVDTSVHESVVDRVKAGMKANIGLDALPGRNYEGTVKEVAVLPDQGGWLSSDTKVYKTIVTIDEALDSRERTALKPGMTAVVKILIAHLDDVLCVPVQAIVQRGKETWCYVTENGETRKCPLELGETNDKLVEILGGLDIGDRVVLNPSAILESGSDEERDIASDKEHRDDATMN